ncbi:LysE family translocator [Corynebacterium frankenforstense]
MTVGSILTLLGVWVAAIVSPGPDVVQITRQGARSKRAGVWAAIGVMTGNAGWILASLLGLSALLTARPALLAWLQLIGGAYLAYLGVSAIRGDLATRRQAARAVHSDVPTDSDVPVTPAAPQRTDADPTVGQAWRAGFATNLANPKAVLFFGAVFAQFIEPGMGWGITVFIAVLLIAVGLVWFVCFALAVRAFSARIAENSAVIDIVTGAIFCLLAAVMIFEGAAGLLGG